MEKQTVQNQVDVSPLNDPVSKSLRHMRNNVILVLQCDVMVLHLPQPLGNIPRTKAFSD